MDTYVTDCIVIGAGIAGASAAAFLAADRRVALIEAEEAAGYHTTGRSAALWILNYGPGDVRALTGASRGFFEAPPAGFSQARLWSGRDVLYLAADMAAADEVMESGVGIRRISVAAAREMVPAIREGAVVARWRPNCRCIVRGVIRSASVTPLSRSIQRGFWPQANWRPASIAWRSWSKRPSPLQGTMRSCSPVSRNGAASVNANKREFPCP